MNKNFSKVLALFLAVIMSLPLACFASIGIFAEGEDVVAAESNYAEPTVSSEAVYYFSFSGKDTNDGLTKDTMKATVTGIINAGGLAEGGTIVIPERGYFGATANFTFDGPVLFTAKDVDGTLYYDPENPSTESTDNEGKGQYGTFIVGPKFTITFGSDVVIDDVVMLSRSCTLDSQVPVLAVGGNATMVIGENVIFARSTATHKAIANTKLKVEYGSKLIVKAAGASAYLGDGDIYIDSSLIGNGITADQFFGFEGRVFDLNGNTVCDHEGFGHNYSLQVVNHTYNYVCGSCGDAYMYTYNTPVVTSDTIVYWKNGGSSTATGQSPSDPVTGGGGVDKIINNGGTVYVTGKGYVGDNYTFNLDGTTKFTAITPDGFDCRNMDVLTGAAAAEFGAILWADNKTLTFKHDLIFESVNILSRVKNANIMKFCNNSTVLFDDVAFNRQNTSQVGITLDIEAGTTVIIKGNCSGTLAAIKGAGTLVIDPILVKAGIINQSILSEFTGLIVTLDSKEVCAFTGGHNYVNGFCDTCGAEKGTTVTKIYVKKDGKGDGLTPENPTNSLRRGFEYSSADPIEIILVDDLEISSGIACEPQSQDVTITSIDLDGDGVYPKLIIKSFINFYNDDHPNTITFENIEIFSDRSGTVSFFMGYNNLVIGDNVTCSLSGNYTTAETGIGVYPSIFAGFLESGGENTVAAKSNSNDCTITVNSGTWRMIVGGNRRNGSEYAIGNNTGDITINVNGGTIIGNENNGVAISGTGENFYSGNININVAGGVIQNDIYGVYDTGMYSGDTLYGAYGLKGDIAIDVTGGNLAGDIYAKAENIRIPALIRGNVDVTIGADVILDDVITVDLRGTVAYAGENKISTANIDEAIIESVICKFIDEVNGEATGDGEPQRIAFVGDSITQGTGSGDYKKYSYPAQFRDMLNSDEYMVGNFGVGASGVFPSTRYYYNDTLQYKLIMEEFEPDVVSFALGTNDAQTAGGVWGCAVDFQNRYYNMIKGIADLDSVDSVYVATPLLRLDNATKQARNAAIIEPAVRNIVADLVANGYDATLFELNANTYEAVVAGQVLGSDKLHPTADGYSVMAQAFYDAIFNGVVDVPDGFYVDTYYVSDNGTQTGTGTAEDPSNLYYLGLSRLNKAGGTIVVLDNYTMTGDVMTPVDIAKLTIIGATAESTLTFTGNTFKLGSDAVIDNIIFNTTSNIPYILAWYNNVTIGENFVNVSAEGKHDLGFVVGYYVYEDVSVAEATSVTYDTVESASSDKNATIVIKNGTWGAILLGNRRLSDKGPIGTYSGNMNVQLLGGKISGNVEDTIKTAILGMNYLTGSIELVIDGMAVEGESFIVSRTATLTGVVYDSANNTGSIKFTAKATVLDAFGENERPNATDKQHAEIANVTLVSTSIAGDLDDDATLANADVALMVRYLSGFAVDGARFTADVNGDGKINNRDAIALINKIA